MTEPLGAGATGKVHSPTVLSHEFALPDRKVARVTASGRQPTEPFESKDAELLRWLCDSYGHRVDMTSAHETQGVFGDWRQLREREIQAQEAERLRIARDLHDDAGHRIMTALLRLDIAATNCRDFPPLMNEFEAVRTLLQECADGLHEVAFSLRPQILGDLGLAPALRSLARRTPPSITAHVNDISSTDVARLPEPVELAAFRIAQEALTNAVKYAQASMICITLEQTSTSLVLTITDNGLGFDPTAVDSSGRAHMGLRGMQERAEILGGTIQLLSTIGFGTTVRAEFSLAQAVTS
jgi:signal transduction histidine kinase